MKLQIKSITAGIVFAAAILSGCGKQSDSSGPAGKPATLVQVAQARKGDLVKSMTLTGSVEPVRSARLASPAEGPILECPVREGDPVKEGLVLVRVGRSRIAETGLEAAREELRRQEAEFARVKQLVESGSLAGEELDVARSNLKRAEAQVAAMETGADDYEIAAPWDGVVSRVWIVEGDYVSPRAPLVELYDPASLVVKLAVPEGQALAVQPGQAVSVSLDAYPGRRLEGTVTRVYPELERATRTVTAEVEIREELRLLIGMFARVEAAVAEATDAVVVPEEALVTLPTGETVAFVLDDGKAVRREVEIALEAGGEVAVSSGIHAGEAVIVRGQDSLRDGAAVRVMGAAPAAGTSGKIEAKDRPTQ